MLISLVVFVTSCKYSGKGIDMNTQRLIQNLIDQIKEAQLKLGYAEESMYFYFPPDSLNDILQTDMKDEESLLKELRQAPTLSGSVLGELGFELNHGRIQVRIPSQGARYVKENVPDPAFLWDLIQLFSQGHDLTIERIKNFFQKFSNNYVCEAMSGDSEFDYVLHFVDESIDSYYYCVKMEMGHTIYHRFTREDYRRLVKV